MDRVDPWSKVDERPELEQGPAPLVLCEVVGCEQEAHGGRQMLVEARVRTLDLCEAHAEWEGGADQLKAVQDSTPWRFADSYEAPRREWIGDPYWWRYTR